MGWGEVRGEVRERAEVGWGEVRGEVRERGAVGCVLDGMSQECVE